MGTPDQYGKILQPKAFDYRGTASQIPGAKYFYVTTLSLYGGLEGADSKEDTLFTDARLSAPG
jgi:hypothetical protein